MTQHRLEGAVNFAADARQQRNVLDLGGWGLHLSPGHHSCLRQEGLSTHHHRVTDHHGAGGGMVGGPAPREKRGDGAVSPLSSSSGVSVIITERTVLPPSFSSKRSSAPPTPTLRPSAERRRAAPSPLRASPCSRTPPPAAVGEAPRVSAAQESDRSAERRGRSLPARLQFQGEKRAPARALQRPP